MENVESNTRPSCLSLTIYLSSRAFQLICLPKTILNVCDCWLCKKWLSQRHLKPWKDNCAGLVIDNGAWSIIHHVTGSLQCSTFSKSVHSKFISFGLKWNYLSLTPLAQTPFKLFFFVPTRGIENVLVWCVHEGRIFGGSWRTYNCHYFLRKMPQTVGWMSSSHRLAGRWSLISRSLTGRWTVIGSRKFGGMFGLVQQK